MGERALEDALQAFYDKREGSRADAVFRKELEVRMAEVENDFLEWREEILSNVRRVRDQIRQLEMLIVAAVVAQGGMLLVLRLVERGG
jgi:hypothetical protein